MGLEGLQEVGVNCRGNPCKFFSRIRQLRSMERETIYVEGDRATSAAESPRFIGAWPLGFKRKPRPIMGRRPRKMFGSIGQNITVQPPNCSM